MSQKRKHLQVYGVMFFMIFITLVMGLSSFVCYGVNGGLLLKKVGGLEKRANYFDHEQGNYGYAVDGNKCIGIYNIKDKLNPVNVGCFQLSTDIYDIQLKGNALLVYDSLKTYLLDVSKPASPVLKGSIVGRITISECDYVFRRYDGIDIIDISDLSNPRVVGKYESPYDFETVKVSGNYMFLKSYESSDGDVIIKLNIVDISVPSKPVQLSVTTLVDGSWRDEDEISSSLDFAVIGNYVYIAHYENGLMILDISNPASPKTVSKGTSFPASYQIEKQGKLIFLRGKECVTIGDITNPIQPQIVSQLAWDGEISNIRVSGNRMSITERDSFVIQIMDISNPSRPSLVRKIDNSPLGSVFGLSGHYGFYSFNSLNYGPNAITGINIIDISNPSAPSIKNTYRFNGYFQCTLSGDSVLMKDWNVLKILDVSNLSLPVFAGQCYVNGEIQGVEGNYAFSSADKFIYFIDISDKRNPHIEGSIELPNQRNEVLLSGNYLIANDFSSECVYIYDISNKSNAVRVGTITNVGLYTKLLLLGDELICLNDRELYVYDISNKSNPVRSGVLSITNNKNLARYGNYLYVGKEYGFYVVDISNPSSPVLKGEFMAPKNGFDNFYISGNYLFIGSLYIFDISNPVLPVKVKIPDVHADGNFFTFDGHFYECGYNALYVYNVVVNSHPSPSLTLFPTSNFAIEQKSVLIHWIAEGITGDVSIELYRNGSFVSTLASVRATDEYYLWNAPANIPLGDGYKFHIFQGNVDAFSENEFKIYSSSEKPMYYIEYDSYPLHIVGAPNQISSSVKFKIMRWSESGAMEKNGRLNDENRSWSIKVSQPWIVLNTVSGTGECEINLSANTSGLVPGTYWGKIEVYSSIGLESSIFCFLSITKSLPVITLSRKNLNFTISGDKYTPAQTVMVDCGENPLYWNTSYNYGILESSGSGYGYGSGKITLGLSEYYIKKIPVGTTTTKISVYSYDAVNSPQEILVSIKKEDSSSVPFGEFSTPGNNGVLSGSIPVTGWALDDLGVESVKIYRDPVEGENSGVSNGRVFIGDAIFVENARPDVELGYPDYPNNYKAGWGYMLLSHMLPGTNDPGVKSYKLYAVAKDQEGNEVTLGSKTIRVDNGSSVKPFGAIDTPTPGETIKGNSYTSFGWALSPVPNMISTDGSSITVWVDGLPVGHPVYNLFREDIARLFPGYANSGGAVGYFTLDTTGYSNGVHTLAWSVKDNAGNEEGVGSRYFTILNSMDSENMASKSLDGVENIVGEIGLMDENVENVEGSVEDVEDVVIEELGRVVVHLNEGLSENVGGGFSGVMMVGEKVKCLPIGSSLDEKNGVFVWNPGPGFLGVYRLVFIKKGFNGLMIKKTVAVKILPKGSLNK